MIYRRINVNSEKTHDARQSWRLLSRFSYGKTGFAHSNQSHQRHDRQKWTGDFLIIQSESIFTVAYSLNIIHKL